MSFFKKLAGEVKEGVERVGEGVQHASAMAKGYYNPNRAYSL